MYTHPLQNNLYVLIWTSSLLIYSEHCRRGTVLHHWHQLLLVDTSTNVLRIQFLLEISPALKGEVQFDPICFEKLDCESTLKCYLYIGICTVTKFYEGRQINLASSKVDTFFVRKYFNLLPALNTDH